MAKSLKPPPKVTIEMPSIPPLGGIAAPRPSIPPPKRSPAKEAAKTARCVVCRGEVRSLCREKIVGTSHISIMEGAYCSVCGLRYEFLPPPIAELKAKKTVSKKF